MLRQIYTAITLTEAGLPTPRTALVTEDGKIEEVHKQVGGKFPVVAKTIRGSKGIGVFIIDSPEGLKIHDASISAAWMKTRNHFARIHRHEE